MPNPLDELTRLSEAMGGYDLAPQERQCPKHGKYVGVWALCPSCTDIVFIVKRDTFYALAEASAEWEALRKQRVSGEVLSARAKAVERLIVIARKLLDEGVMQTRPDP